MQTFRAVGIQRADCKEEAPVEWRWIWAVGNQGEEVCNEMTLAAFKVFICFSEGIEIILIPLYHTSRGFPFMRDVLSSIYDVVRVLEKAIG